MSKTPVAIQVCVRIRNVGCADEHAIQCVRNEIRAPECSAMQFDRVFPPSASQGEVFSSVKDAVEVALGGYKSTILAYGQTGSGKTYSMLGENGGLSLSEEKMGIIPRSTRFLFSRIAEATKSANGTVQFQLRASFVEVYNGRAFDLLSKTARKPLAVRESAEGDVEIAESVEIPVQSTQAVMKVLSIGAQNRATGATDMNLHSSRSHAVFMLKVEQRQRTDAGSRTFKRLLGRVNLVDLAGSEDISRSHAQGQRFKEAVEINTGLLQLHRVLEAIRDQKPFIPFRDSVLTRLLKDSLGGSARTVLLATVSPLPQDLAQTLSSLRYAGMARVIKNKQLQTAEEGEDEALPMDNDFVDPEGLNRRTVQLQTASFGPVFARVAGDPAGELVLLVHGSGPENSSMWWNRLVVQLLTLDPAGAPPPGASEAKNASSRSSPSHRATAPAAAASGEATRARALFLVAIDCPGYGRSAGDKQTIRSSPGALLGEVVAAAAPHSAQAYCLVGSSQGAAASFNALVERPRIAKFLAVMDPVSHDPARFSAISQPTLMVYDRDDPGHPVSVGRVAAKHLQDPRYSEFASSSEPDWLRRNFARELLRLWRERDPAGPGCRRFQVEGDGAWGADPGGMALAGGVLAWASLHGREGYACWADRKAEERDRARLQQLCEEGGVQEGAGAGGFFAGAEEAEEEASEVRFVRGGKAGGGDPAAASEGAAATPELGGDAQGLGAADGPEEHERAAEIVACCVCGGSRDGDKQLEVGPEVGASLLVLPGCGHALCVRCAGRTLGIDPWRCPAGGCGRRLPAATRLPAVVKAPPVPKGQGCVVLEYGNTAEAAGGQGKVSVTAFVRVVSVADAGVPAASLIKSVAFDINPSYPGSAPKVSRAPWELTRCMAGRFPCDFIISWEPRLGWQPLRICFTVVHEEARHRRRLRVLVVPLPADVRKLAEARVELSRGGSVPNIPIVQIGQRAA